MAILDSLVMAYVSKLFERQQIGTIFSEKSFWVTSESDITAFHKSLLWHHHQVWKPICKMVSFLDCKEVSNAGCELGHWDWSSMLIGSVIWTLKWIWGRRALMIHIYSLMYRDFSFFWLSGIFSWRSEFNSTLTESSGKWRAKMWILMEMIHPSCHVQCSQ